MRLLIANVFFPPHSFGGATIVAQELARALHATDGIEVIAFSAMSRPEFPAYALSRSEWRGITNWMINLPPDRSREDSYQNAEVAKVFSRLLVDIEPDLVHVHCVQDIGAHVLQACHDANTPSILSMHDFWWFCERQFMIDFHGQYCGQSQIRPERCARCVADRQFTRKRRAYLGAQLELPSLITMPSHFATDLVKATAPNIADKCVTLENGVRTPDAKFFEAQARRRARDARLCFGFIGGPGQIKGWPLIRDAFTTLGSRDIRGVLVDGALNGGWFDDLTGAIAKMSGDWQIHPRFDQAHLDSFYAEIDVLLFPSQWKETFGLAIREAISRGIDVIQTDGGGAIEHMGSTRRTPIPIGAPMEALRAQIKQVIDAHPNYPQPVSVADYQTQATRFLALAQNLNQNL